MNVFYKGQTEIMIRIEMNAAEATKTQDAEDFSGSAPYIFSIFIHYRDWDEFAFLLLFQYNFYTICICRKNK